MISDEIGYETAITVLPCLLFSKVNKYNSANEAYVRRCGVSGKTKDNESDILIVGKDRNRAIHGDTVVVELLPEAQWKSK